MKYKGIKITEKKNKKNKKKKQVRLTRQMARKFLLEKKILGFIVLNNAKESAIRAIASGKYKVVDAVLLKNYHSRIQQLIAENIEAHKYALSLEDEVTRLKQLIPEKV